MKEHFYSEYIQGEHPKTKLGRFFSGGLGENVTQNNHISCI